MSLTVYEKSGYHYRGPSIDHSILSPSGRMSKRARKAAETREAVRLFPPGSNFLGPRLKTDLEQRQEKIATLLATAANLRGLAARGMSARKFTREAVRLEAEATAMVTS